MKNVLTIAGSDCSGGAGIQADLKTFSAHGVYGMSVITSITAQNTQGVFAIQDITDDMVEKQIEVIFEDIRVDAIKIGMVSKVPIIKAIARKLREYKAKNIVIDPVMISKSGFDLLSPEAKETLINELIPLATLITPNLPEASAISNCEVNNVEEMKEVAKKIYELGAKNVLIKGGHLDCDATDVLFDGSEFHLFTSKRIVTKNTHGTGCTLSSAIASNLALGNGMATSIKNAKDYINIAIKHSLDIGKGVGPTNHFYSLYKKAGLL